MLMTLLALVLGVAIGYYKGKRDGEADMYQLCSNADEVRRKFFSELSRK